MKRHEKGWYVEHHREMWTWISKEIRRRKELVDITSMKFEWLDLNGFTVLNGDNFPTSGCFACEYKGEGFCDVGCLFNWSSSEEERCFVHCTYGVYGDCRDARTWQEQAELAGLIANLPVREEV